MYLARFAFGETNFITGVLSWLPSGSLMPRNWIHQLCAQSQMDLGLRIVSEGGCVRVVLFVSADANAASELRACCESLVAQRPADIVVPANAAEFDDLTSSLSPWQMRVNHDGYHHRGRPLACNFRLYAAFANTHQHETATYQLHLRSHRPTSEMERQVLKYLAWLDLEKPFNVAVRDMQKTLVQKLGQDGWLADEYLIVEDSTALERWLTRIREHFSQTTGRIGFSEAPVERGDFTDWLGTGCHTERYATVQASLPGRGARMFSAEEVEWLFSSEFAPDPVFSGALAPRVRKPEVFISYASTDFAFAAEVCRYLEGNGVACWIAPRDIERDVLPYPEALQLGLSQVRAVIVIVSQMANLSVHIPREVDIALERKLVVVPIRLENVLPTGQLNYLLRTCQWLNAFERVREDAMGELLTRIRKL
jgi:hypothetical protein